jgi:hypothetical protein
MNEKIASGSTVATYVASAVAVVSGLTLTEWGVIIGTAIGILTFLTNWIFRRRESKANIAARELEAERLRLDIERARLELEGVKMRQHPRPDPQGDDNG